MLTRALIVLLLVLNLGVAVWWATRAPAAAPSPAAAEPGVARLLLPGEAAVAVTRMAARSDADDDPIRCVSLGPFDSEAAAARARGQLQSQVRSLSIRREYAGTPRNWQVFMPPFDSVEQAEAAAQRVAAAGFSDYYVVREGEQAGSLALGLYSQEATARKRVATLAAAGLVARAAPLGAGPAQRWLDVVAAGGFDPARAQSLVGAQQRQRLDCAQLAAAEL